MSNPRKLSLIVACTLLVLAADAYAGGTVITQPVGQQRVTGTCIGQVMVAIAANGTVTCEADDDTGFVTAGTGLTATGTTVNAIAGSGITVNADDIAIDPTYTQRRVSGTCAAGSSIASINQDGTVTCETDDDTTYTAGGGLTLGGGAFSIADADRGDITISSSGTVFTIDNGVVTLAKQADIATARIVGRVTAGTGSPEALTGTQATTLLDTFSTSGTTKGLVAGSNGATTSFLRGDNTWQTVVTTETGDISAVTAGAGLINGGTTGAVTLDVGAGTAITVNADDIAVSTNGITDTLLRDSAALSVIGRSANSTGDPADIAAGSDGQVLRRSGTSLGFGTVATAGYTDDSVTYAKIQNVTATDRLLCRDTAGAGDMEECAFSSDFAMSSLTFDLSSTVTAPGSLTVATSFGAGGADTRALDVTTDGVTTVRYDDTTLTRPVFIVNRGIDSAADGTGIEFDLAAGAAAPAVAGSLDFIGENTTHTGATADGAFSLKVALNGTNTERLKITSDGTTTLTGAPTISGLATLTSGFSLGADSSAASHKITNLTNGSSAQDAAAFGQIATAVNAAVSGTLDKVPLFTGTNTIGNSAITRSSNTYTLSTSDSTWQVTSTSADSTARLKLTNDAQTWQVSTRGDVSDALIIRDETAGSDLITVAKSTGNVGIGTTPASTIKFDLRDSSTKDAMLLYHTGGAGTYTASADFFAVRNDDTSTSYDLLDVAVANDDTKRLRFTSAGTLSVGGAFQVDTAGTVTDANSAVLVADETVVTSGTIADTTNGIHLGFASNVGTISAEQPGTAYRRLLVGGADVWLVTGGAARVDVQSTGKVLLGDTSNTSVDNNVDVFTVANTGTGQTGTDLTVVNSSFTGSVNTTGGVLATYAGRFQNTTTRSAGANGVSVVGIEATSQSASDGDRYAAILRATTSHTGASYGVYSDVTGGSANNYSFFGNRGTLFNNDGAVINGATTIASSTAANAVTASYTGTAQTVDRSAVTGANTGTFNATSSNVIAYGVIGSSAATRSAGANSVYDVGLYGAAAGGQVNLGLWVDVGSTQIDENAGVGVSVDSTVQLKVDGSTRVNTGYFQAVGSATAADRAVLSGVGSGTYDATGAARAVYGIIGEAYGSRSAGANTVRNIGGYFDATGGQIDDAIVAARGNVQLNVTSGSTNVYGPLAIGDNAADAHSLTGTLNANSTAGSNGEVLTIVSGVPKWAAAAGGGNVSTAGLTSPIIPVASGASTLVDSNIRSDSGSVYVTGGSGSLTTTGGVHIFYASNAGTISATTPGTANRQLTIQGNDLILQGNGSTALTISGNDGTFADALTINGNATIGDAKTDQHVINGEVNFDSTGGDTVDVVYSGTTQTTDRMAIHVVNSGTYNTTGAVRTAYGVRSEVTATRSSGANNLLNYASYFTATGAQDNYAIWTESGHVILNNAADGTVRINGSNTTINSPAIVIGDGNGDQVTITGWTQINQTADQDVTNAGVTDSNTLTFQTAAGKSYLIDGVISAGGSNATGDYIFDFAVSSGTMDCAGTEQSLTTADAIQNTVITATAAANTGSTSVGTRADASIGIGIRFVLACKVSNVATFKYRFGNASPSGGRTSRTKAGSYIRYKQLD